MKKIDNKDEGQILLVLTICLFVGLLLLMSFFSEDVVEIYESGTLNSFQSFPQKTKLTIQVDYKDYNKSFIRTSNFEDYESWLVQWIGYEVDFYYYEGGNFYDLYVHDVKNVTVKQVRYKEDGWWDKPPMRVIFSDGSDFSFTGSSEYKFDMYAQFIAFDTEYVSIDYSFDVNEDIRIHNIERIEENLS